MDKEAKLSAVRVKLAAVLDPELDESLTELGFIESLDVDADDRVHVRVRLPTYWCAANFAFMMASDARERIKELPWVKEVMVDLDGHFYSDRINQGIQRGSSFVATCEGEASDELHELRAIFRAKAFEGRQHEIIRHLIAHDYSPEKLAAMTVEELSAIGFDDAEGNRLRRRYLEARAQRPDGAPPGSRAFIQLDGTPLPLDRFSDYLARIRRSWLNKEVNGALCRGLLDARYGAAEKI